MNSSTCSARRLALDEGRHRRRVVGAASARAARRRSPSGLRRLARRPDELEQLGLEAALELGAEREQRRLPLPRVVDAVEAAVVQLVAAVQRELEVLGLDVAGRRIEPVRRRRAARRTAPRSRDRGAAEAWACARPTQAGAYLSDPARQPLSRGARLAPRADAELGQHGRDVVVDGLGRDHEPPGDLRVGRAARTIRSSTSVSRGVRPGRPGARRRRAARAGSAARRRRAGAGAGASAARAAPNSSKRRSASSRAVARRRRRAARRRARTGSRAPSQAAAAPRQSPAIERAYGSGSSAARRDGRARAPEPERELGARPARRRARPRARTPAARRRRCRRGRRRATRAPRAPPRPARAAAAPGVATARAPGLVERRRPPRRRRGAPAGGRARSAPGTG